MVVDINTKYDLFIAYHGDDKTGTAKKAEQIYKKLSTSGRKVFFHRVTNRTGAYRDNPIVANNSKLFYL